MGGAARPTRHHRRAVPHTRRDGPSLTGPPSIVPGARPSPNIWHHPATYEIENRAVDPDGLIETAMRSIADWADRDVLDIGCGTGFHLPRFAQSAASVTGVEPHGDLAAIATRRTRRTPRVRVLHGAAQSLPLPEASVDIAHARWAYFFGPGCEPGLAELARVLRPGGTAFVIDNDPTTSTFGSWFRKGFTSVDPATVEQFWVDAGWHRERILTRWSFETRADFEAVVAIEFNPETAAWIVAHHRGREVDYAVNLWWRRFSPPGVGATP